ncbi:glycosyltransferase family 2 protein [Candidatus Woesearchaeota archaeon]|jgi:poly-beta-1,6-N-acetyl-D-glucosamine synthase|nr:glycosyltransferase family 2 protein [Candidatus Woesearchaeota archaeon]
MLLTGVIVSIIVFISLYITIVWISFLYLYEKKPVEIKNYPKITIAIPAFNEEKAIEKTILTALKLEYPKNKLNIVVIDDGSTDNTKKIVQSLSKKHNFKFISKKNEGKAKALNIVLEKCKTNLFACLDADSYVEPDSLKRMLHHFDNPKVAATITAIHVIEPKNLYEKLQRMEYLLAIMTRKLMAFINTLSVTPGVLSVYKTKILQKVGGFDNETLTEDFEIAMRLKFYGYDIEIETSAKTYTYVPNNFKKLWRQRVRWYRGFVESHRKYHKMFLNKKYGRLAYFQMPLNIIGILLLVAAVAFVSYGNIINIYHLIRRSMLIKGFFFSHIFSFIKPKDIILTQNIKIMFPVWIALFLGILIFYLAHTEVKEKIKFPFTIWAFFILLPILTALHWLGAIFEELLKAKKKW